MPARLLFLPTVRQGLAASLVTPDNGQPVLAGVPDLAVQLDLEGALQPPGVTVRLNGPGEVLGLDPRQVLRTEPAAGSTDFEALDLAAIEFDNPDLPWLFTPAAPRADGRLRPWLCLVVLRKQEGVSLRPARTEALPVLDIAPPARPADELPDLAESWAWAHAQLGLAQDAPVTDTLVNTVLAQQPELSLSRLLCPRLLQPHTDYLACVVPTFVAGRLAGLNQARQPDDRPDLAPAWLSGADADPTLQLPVYYHWEFRTGAREDFETIVDRLQPRELPAGVGQRPMDITQPGFKVPATPGAPPRVMLEGALLPAGQAREPWPAAGLPWQQALQQIVNAGAAPSPAGNGDPVVGPPMYGQWLARRDSVSALGTPTWLDDVNLDPRERVAAALGTQVVQDQQDELMAQAWAQVGELAAVNRRLRQVQLAGTVGGQLQRKHVDPLVAAQAQGGNTAALADDLLWRLAAPAQRRLMVAGPDGSNSGQSLQSALQGSQAPNQALSAPLRRLARNRGPLARRADTVQRKAVAAGRLQATTTTTAISTATSTSIATTSLQVLSVYLQPLVLSYRILLPQGRVSLDDVTHRLAAPNNVLLWTEITDAKVRGTAKRPSFAVTPEPLVVTGVIGVTGVTGTVAPLQPGTLAARLPPVTIDPDPELPENPTEPPLRPPVVRPVDSADAAAFRLAAAAHLQRLHPAPPPQAPIFIALSQVYALQRTPLQHAINPGPALQLRLQASVRVNDAPAPPTRVGPLGAVPSFSQPGSEPLARLSQEWLLPGLEQVPRDTVALLQPNQRFIEAFMLGLNVEMSREFLWRDYPLAHEQGTYFNRFWRPAGPTTPPDITPLAQWGTQRLGAHHPGGNTVSAKQQVVMLLRSTLLQRYPGTIIYAVPAQGSGAQRQPHPDPALEKLPLYRGTLPPDVSFFGFDIALEDAVAASGWYFVLQQQPTEPRFGFDNDVDFHGAQHLRVNAVPATTSGPAHSANLALWMLQAPVRVFIHASELLLPG